MEDSAAARDAPVDEASEPVHFAVCFCLVHGNNGAASDWDELVQHAEKQSSLRASNVHFFRWNTAENLKTLCGVEELAGKLVDQLRDYLEKDMAEYDRIGLYLISHSLGGLVSRWALPALLEMSPRLQPLGYLSMSSPHVGTARPGGSLVKDVYKYFIEAGCKKAYKQTGADLIYLDHDTHQEDVQNSVLYRLSETDGPFLQALLKFPLRTLVALPFHDMLVPYCTASATPLHPYDEKEMHEESSGRPFRVWGYAGFAGRQEAYHDLIDPCARPNARGRPELTQPEQAEVLDLGGGWQTDRHRFVRWPAAVMRNLHEVGFRRLDVMLDVPSRFLAHDGVLKKALRGIFPDSGPAGDEFLSLLTAILALDIDPYLAEHAES